MYIRIYVRTKQRCFFFIENYNCKCIICVLQILTTFLIFSINVLIGDISGQIEPLLSSFDEPTPLTAIPVHAVHLKRLGEEESTLIENDDDEDDDDTDADSRLQHHRHHIHEDEDAKIPLLTSPEVSYLDTLFNARIKKASLLFIQKICYKFANRNILDVSEWSTSNCYMT